MPLSWGSRSVGADGARDPFVLEVLRRASQFVELLIQERAFFKDRSQPTYMGHRQRYAIRWREHTGLASPRGKAADARRADHNVMGDLLYGTIFTNYFAGPRQSPEAQARTSSTSS